MKTLRKFEEIYRRIIAQQMQNLPQIKTFEQNRKQDYIGFFIESDEPFLQREYDNIEKLQLDYKTNNIHIPESFDIRYDYKGKLSYADQFFATQLGNEIEDECISKGSKEGLLYAKECIDKVIKFIKIAKQRNWIFDGHVPLNASYGMGGTQTFYIPQNQEDLLLFIQLFFDVFYFGCEEKEKVKKLFKQHILTYLQTKNRQDLVFTISGQPAESEFDTGDYTSDPVIDLNMTLWN